MESIIRRLGTKISGWPLLDHINAINTSLLILALLLLHFLSFSLNSNEEQYLQLAKQFYDPEWIKNSINFNEFAGTRLLYQYISGFFLSFLSFEYYVFLGRLVLALLYTLPLTKLYRTLGISNVGILLHLPVLFLVHQSMFATSFIFLSVESSGFAYFFVLYALVFLIQCRYGWMIAMLVAASYFHILVGGYAFIYLGATMVLFDPTPWQRKLVLLIVYAVCLLPFVLYLQTSVTVARPTIPSADWIYTYFRAPHHTALFQSPIYFYRNHFYGVLIAVIALTFSISLASNIQRADLKRLNFFIILSLAGTLAAVVLAFFDKTGQFVKYYPFRINTLSTFALTLIMAYLLTDIIRGRYAYAINLTIVALSAFFTLQSLLPNVYLSYLYFSRAFAAFDQMSTYIANHTDQDDIILYLDNPTGDIEDVYSSLTLTRKTRRSRFVSYKFIPAELGKIPEWYDRVLMKQAVSADINRLPTLRERYRVDYLLTTQNIHSPQLRLVYSKLPYLLYEVESP